MKKTNEQIDQIIHEALSKEEAEFYDQLGEQSLLEMSLGVFQGKNKVIYILTTIMAFVWFVGFIFCVVRFIEAETTRELITYAAAGFWCILSVTAIKLWHWMQMNTNRILREMKRLELQIAAVAENK